jgi:hypothetical protein
MIDNLPYRNQSALRRSRRSRSMRQSRAANTYLFHAVAGELFTDIAVDRFRGADVGVTAGRISSLKLSKSSAVKMAISEAATCRGCPATYQRTTYQVPTR